MKVGHSKKKKILFFLFEEKSKLSAAYLLVNIIYELVKLVDFKNLSCETSP